MADSTSDDATAVMNGNGKHAGHTSDGACELHGVAGHTEHKAATVTRNGLAPLTIPTSGSSTDTLQDSQRTPTDETGALAQLVLPQSAPQTPTKPVNHYPSWKRGSTGSPYNVKVGSTTPSPAGRTVERCRMDVLSCSKEASEWALQAWTNSTAWRALCDIDHGRHKLIRVIMHDRPRVFPTGNPVAFEPQFVRTNCYFIVWNTAETASMEQALSDLKEIRQHQADVVVLMMGCLLQKDAFDHTWDTDSHALHERTVVEAMLADAALATDNLTMAFARCDADVESNVLHLLFKSMQTKLDASFFLQYQYIASFYASSRFLNNIWSLSTRVELDLEMCLEALVEGLDIHLKQDASQEMIENYLQLVTVLTERGAPIDHLGVLSNAHPKAVEELVYQLRIIKDHTLDLSGLRLPTVHPTRIMAMAELLHRVDVSNNQLHRLPLEIFLLPNLVTFKAAHNHLQFLPAFPRWRCSNLQVLDVSHNELICPLDSQDYNNFTQFQLNPADSSAATSMLGKSSLTYMPLASERQASPFTASTSMALAPEPPKTQAPLASRLLSSLSGLLSTPPTVKQIKRTTCVPPDIFTMKNLTSVNLRSNRLEELPIWVTILPKLWSLDLRDNPNLHRLPPELARARGLFLLRVEGLQLTSPPPQELERGSKAVVCYLRSQLKLSISYRHMKLMVVGETAAGKTTLLSCLSGEVNSQRTHQDELLSTVGVSMGMYTCQRPREGRRGGDAASQPVYFQTLDFAGQHEYDSTHQCFFSHRAVYVGVFDMMHGYDGIAALRPWLMSIQACAPGSPVVLVGTHADLASQADENDLLAAAQQECSLGRPASYSSSLGLPKIVSVHFVSGTTGDGINALKETIYMEAVQLTDPHSIFKEPYLAQMVPGSYLELHQRLQREADALKARDCCPVIKHEQLLELVKQAPPLDIEDSEELAQACRFLHGVGVLLHYEPPPTRCTDPLYFIEPQWLSNALARIVTTRERSLAYRGLLSTGHLPLIFKDLLVPPALYSSFMDLLETFEILVPLDKDNTVYLVPALLPKQTEKLPVLSATCCVARIYDLAFIPAGLWTRLISRLVAFFDLQPSSVDTASASVDDADAPVTKAQSNLSAPATPNPTLQAAQQQRRVSSPRKGASLSLPNTPLHAATMEPTMTDSGSGSAAGDGDSGSDRSAAAGGNFVSVASHERSSSSGNSTARLQDVLNRRRKWHCWQNGGVFYLRQQQRASASTSGAQSKVSSQLEENFIVVQEGRHPCELVLFVQSNDFQCGAELLSNTVTQLDTLLTEWYPGLCEEPCQVEQFIPCPSCMRLASQMAAPPAKLVECSHLYTINECLEAAQSGQLTLPCPACGCEQKISDMAPDLTLCDLPCVVSMTLNEHMLLDKDERNCLGRGAFGEVYAGFWQGAAAAIKLVLPEEGRSASSEVVQLYQVLRDEADIMSRLHHPRILTLLGVCLSPSAVVLELAPQGTLRDAVRKRNGLSCSLVHRIIRQIAQGLQYLHENNIIFRDLKPDNVLVWSIELPTVRQHHPAQTPTASTAAVFAEPRPRSRSVSALKGGVCVKLADYSLAKYASSGGTLLQAKGTEGYMAPEVVSGCMERRFAYDCKADLFSLGVVMFECVVAQRPFWQLGKWKFMEYAQEGRCPSMKKGLEGYGDERSVDETTNPSEADPLRMSSNSSTGSAEKLDRDGDGARVADSDTVSLSSLYSVKTATDLDDPDGAVVVSSLYSRVVYVKRASSSDLRDDEQVSNSGDDAKDNAEDESEDESCLELCMQSLLRRCMTARSHLRPSAQEVAQLMAVCHGTTDPADTMQISCETGLAHFAAEPPHSVNKTHRIWSCAGNETRLVCLSLPGMRIKSAQFSNPASKNSTELSPASRFSAVACTPMPRRRGQRVSAGALVWLATLSGHLVALNGDSMQLEGFARLPASVVSMVMLPSATVKRHNHSSNDLLMVVGLLDGRVAVIKATQKDGHLKVALWEQLNVTCVATGMHAVSCIAMAANRKVLWLAHGSKIIAVDVAQLSKLRSWESGHQGDFRRGGVRCLCPVNVSGLDSFSLSVDVDESAGNAGGGGGGSAANVQDCSQPVLCSSFHRCSTVRLWNSQGQLLAEINCEDSLPQDKERSAKLASQVVCLYSYDQYLWVGTRSGYLLVYDIVTHSLITAVRYHSRVNWIGAAARVAENPKHSVCSVIVCGEPLRDITPQPGGSMGSPVVSSPPPPLVSASQVQDGGGAKFVQLDLLLD
ncbi:uncharacterized protein LOC135820827 [Sycon ciliatum]|uniref:uncharacterized protein LOC135820827 n=1 Tax=Sycon ciliatum TaxID=27933 RepID=UPI0031F6F0FD